MATRFTPHPWFDAEMLVGLETNGYTLRRVVGVGGFGAVYLTQSRDGEDRVIKVLYPPDSKSTNDMKDWGANNTRFLREVAIVERFDHPNIIKIYDIGSLFWHFDDPLRGEHGHNDHSNDYLLPFYVADYLPDGLDLHIRANKLLDYRQVVLIGAQICDGLSALHNSNPPVLHRDLNPRNIRLADGNRPIITDFGVARSATLGTGDVTMELRTIIPPDVAAPEQLVGEEPDARTDIYQVGALLLAMLTGKFPRAVNIPAVLTASPVPRDLARAIVKCLAPAKERRFQDVLTLRTALLETRPPASARPFLFLAKLLGNRVHGWVLNQFAGLVPPSWRKREFWFPLFVLPLILAAFWWFQPTEPVEITMANSSAKKEFITDALEQLHETSPSDKALQISTNFGLKNKSISVHRILEELEPGRNDDYRSGSMIRDILNGKIKPVIASPAERYWIDLLMEQSPSITTGEAVGVANTPFVIAMWRSRAVALGCWPTPGPECTWAQLRKLAASPNGWGMLGHPEWGRLKVRRRLSRQLELGHVDSDTQLPERAQGECCGFHRCDPSG